MVRGEQVWGEGRRCGGGEVWWGEGVVGRRRCGRRGGVVGGEEACMVGGECIHIATSRPISAHRGKVLVHMAYMQFFIALLAVSSSNCHSIRVRTTILWR